MSKPLVAYFSASGRTKRAAAVLADATGADTYEIRPAVPYTEADLNWVDKNSRTTMESQDPAARPALADLNAPIADHDVILVGFPIWWYTAPAIIRSFMEAYDFSGKTVIPFATSGGSGIGQSSTQIQSSAPGAAVKKGRLLNGSAGTPDAVRQWAEKIGII